MNRLLVNTHSNTYLEDEQTFCQHSFKHLFRKWTDFLSTLTWRLTVENEQTFCQHSPKHLFRKWTDSVKREKGCQTKQENWQWFMMVSKTVAGVDHASEEGQLSWTWHNTFWDCPIQPVCQLTSQPTNWPNQGTNQTPIQPIPPKTNSTCFSPEVVAVVAYPQKRCCRTAAAEAANSQLESVGFLVPQDKRVFIDGTLIQNDVPKFKANVSVLTEPYYKVMYQSSKHFRHLQQWNLGWRTTTQIIDQQWNLWRTDHADERPPRWYTTQMTHHPDDTPPRWHITQMRSHPDGRPPR